MTVREYLAGGRPLLFDGAMGTWFAARTKGAAGACEQANLTRPEEIAAIHRAYLDAGCRAIKTNTFSLGAGWFAAGKEKEGAELLNAACRLAQTAAAPCDAFVFGDMGPLPETDGVSAADIFCRQAELFLAQGVTGFLVETLPSDKGIAELARYLKARRPDSFLLVSFAVGADGVTADGLDGKALLRRTAAVPGLDAVGFNCMSGPHHLLDLVRRLALPDVTLSVMPNAGYPTVLGRRTVYQGKPDYFAAQLAQLVAAGAAIVGGCCGTTPAHIAAAAQALRTAQASPLPMVRFPAAPHTETSKENTLWARLEAGQRVVAVELDPPVDDDPAPFLSGVAALRDAGADAVTIADCPIGRPRADSSLLACRLKRELGVEPLPHMTCRDRNLNAIKALLLGLSMEGIHNVLLVTGDPIPTADRDEVKSVFNFNSRKLIRYVSGLNESVLHTPFRMFGALNLNARNFDIQLRLAQEKEANGASGFLTQPVHSAQALENLKLARRTLRGKILGGVFPIVSYRNACFLNNEVSGIRVCDEIVQLYEGRDRAEGEALAVRISAKIMEEMAPYVDGFYLMTPFRRVELMRRLIQTARALPDG